MFESDVLCLTMSTHLIFFGIAQKKLRNVMFSTENVMKIEMNYNVQFK